MSNMHTREPAHLEYPYNVDDVCSNDAEVLAAVLNALHHHSGVPSDHIRAEVKDGKVILNGVVCQDYEKTLAEKAAIEAQGVVMVTNNITLKS
jgi:osmotically-inducible protein OsmY